MPFLYNGMSLHMIPYAQNSAVRMRLLLVADGLEVGQGCEVAVPLLELMFGRPVSLQAVDVMTKFVDETCHYDRPGSRPYRDAPLDHRSDLKVDLGVDLRSDLRVDLLRCDSRLVHLDACV